MKKIVSWLIAIVILLIVFFFYFRFYYVYGTGISTGDLNYVVKQGFVFKTYEGKMIQTGFTSKTAGALESREFNFSVADDSIANKLMNVGPSTVSLHYKRFLGSLPWRGSSRFVVDGIISIQPSSRNPQQPPMNP
jgi:hypothetical protein